MQKYIWNEISRSLFDWLLGSSHAAQLVTPESGNVPRIGLGENEPPFLRSVGAQLYGYCTSAREELCEWISTGALFLRRDPGSYLVRGEVAGPVQQMRKLVVGSGAPAWRRSASLRKRLLDSLERDVVASLATHHFVE
jgi:hypothetical protein